jgi:putative tryptophan/tyrosine transport system substrate-binding protein
VLDSNRRAFVTLLGGAAAWPIVGRAQQSDRMRRVGVLMNNAEADSETKAQLLAFRQELQQLGWSEGRNLRIDTLFAADKPDRYAGLAKELVALQPDAIFAYTTPITVALRAETRITPIVFAQVSDPVGSGLVASLAEPQGNVTGVLLYEAGITGKWAAMLKEIAPRLKRAALLANPKTMPYDYFVRSAEAVAPSLAIELVPIPIDSAGDIEHAMAAFADTPDGGLLVLPSGTTTLHRDLVVALAASYRLPAVYPFSFYVTAGGLMSYSTDLVDQSRQAATCVDRILRGANPADLPVQAPTKYVTTLNLKTAKALGLEVPPSLLVRADEVIE